MYLPLKHLEEGKLKKTVLDMDGPLDYLRENSHVKSIRNISIEDFTDFVFSENFMNPLYYGEHKDLNDFVLSTMLPNLFGVADFKKYIENFGTKAILADMRDVLAYDYVLQNWSENKQVYKLDEDFTDALIKTEKFEITRDQIDHLPCRTFYIDLESCPKANPIGGAFVYIKNSNDGLICNVYLLTYEGTFFSYYAGPCCVESNNGIFHVNKSLIADKKFNIMQSHEDFKEPVYSRKELSLLALQLICYITSKEPDINENDVTKSTYKRPKKDSKPKNKFSEIQKWDVGYKYGKTIRTKIKEAEKQYYSSQRIGSNQNSKKRAPLTPHFRCAHWHHYWTGKGRTEYEVRWIEPTFVGFGDSIEKKAIHATIHKVE